MPGVVWAHGELRRNSKGVGAGNFLQRVQHRSNIVRRVERQRLGMFAVSAARGMLGVFQLQVRGIGEQDVAQLDCSCIGIDRAVIAVAHEARQISRVVQVRVCQHAPIECRGLFRQGIPVAQAQFLQALEQAAVHQQALAFRFHQIFRARDGSGRAKKCEFRHRGDILMEVFTPRA